MLGGKVYYNFAADALQFRPKGIGLDEIVKVINEHYIPIAKKDPMVLNYPELSLYVQFPEQAEELNLDPEPYKKLAERLRQAARSIVMPSSVPEKENVTEFESADECLRAIKVQLDRIREKSAKEYVKAARITIFDLEDVRLYIEGLEKSGNPGFAALLSEFGAKNAEDLRAKIIYDESIPSFEPGDEERFKYLGSFEISLERSFAPASRSRSFKKGREIADGVLEEKVAVSRRALEYREKVKFELFRDYDTLKQLIETLGRMTGLGMDIYMLEINEIGMTVHEPLLADYRISFRKQLKEISGMFSDPIFEDDLKNGVRRNYEGAPELIFGSLPDGEYAFKIGENALLVNAVDQTLNVDSGIKLIFVSSNIRPGSHLFTVLSDYATPVIALPSGMLDPLREAGTVKISKKGDNIELLRD